MARRGKAISVKIATDKVIKALETSLTNKKNAKTQYNTAKAKFEKDLEKWEKDVAKLVKSNAKPEEVNVTNGWRGTYVTFQYKLDESIVPERPEAPQSISDWQLKEQIEEIENAIRMLKMTDEEVVSTSTYNTIAQYL